MKRKKAIFFVLFGSDLGCVCVCVRVRACVRGSMTTGKTIALNRQTFVGKVLS